MSQQPLEIPAELESALNRNPLAQAVFAQLSPSHQQEHIRYITEAKKAETRLRRVEKTVACLLREQPGK